MPYPNFAASNGRRGAPSFLVSLRTLALAFALAGAGCGEEVPATSDGGWGGWGDDTDAAASPQDAGTQGGPDANANPNPNPNPWTDAGNSPVEPLDADVPPADSGSPADSGASSPEDAGTVIPLDDASVPAPEGGGAWKLKQGSAPECPEEPPPIPLLGGLCLGIYWSCGWENEQGQQYSCVCDWVHYLCLPL